MRKDNKLREKAWKELKLIDRYINLISFHPGGEKAYVLSDGRTFINMGPYDGDSVQYTTRKDGSICVSDDVFDSVNAAYVFHNILWNLMEANYNK